MDSTWHFLPKNTDRKLRCVMSFSPEPNRDAGVQPSGESRSFHASR